MPEILASPSEWAWIYRFTTINVSWTRLRALGEHHRNSHRERQVPLVAAQAGREQLCDVEGDGAAQLSLGVVEHVALELLLVHVAAAHTAGQLAVEIGPYGIVLAYPPRLLHVIGYRS
jgi:hypothetical protein